MAVFTSVKNETENVRHVIYPPRNVHGVSKQLKVAAVSDDGAHCLARSANNFADAALQTWNSLKSVRPECALSDRIPTTFLHTDRAWKPSPITESTTLLVVLAS